MKSHSFSIELAEVLSQEIGKDGDRAAIIINDLFHWYQMNQKNNKNFFDGRYWTYNSLESWKAHFPYLKENEIRGILQRLEKHGWIITGNYNKVKFDRTKWYSLTDKALEKIENPSVESTSPFVESTNRSVESTNQSCGMYRPIPDTDTDTYTDTENTHENENNSLKQQFEEVRQKYKEHCGTVRGLETEFKNLKKHKDWKEVIPLLLPALRYQKQVEKKKKEKKKNGEDIFCPEWKNFKTWINQRCWEEEYPEIISEQEKERINRLPYSPQDINNQNLR